LSKHQYVISNEFFSLTKDQIQDDIYDFFIYYVESIGGYHNFGLKHSNRSKELYMSSWIEYRDKNVNFEDN
jgi:hypothetical protein